MQGGSIAGGGLYSGVEKILPKQVDFIGLSVYGGTIVLCLLCLVYTELLKAWRRRRHGDPILKGAVRWAAAAGDLEALDALSLAPQFDIESALDGFTALHAAAIGGHRDAVLWLCQRGADVHALKNDGWDDTALHYAAARGDLGTAQVLLSYGADPSPVNAYAATPAELARKRRHEKLANLLDAFDSGKSKPPLPKELEGWKPLDRAVSDSGCDTADIEAGSKSAKMQSKRTLSKEQDVAWRAAMARSHDGLGTEGTKMKPYTKLYRILAVLMQGTSLAYLAWRGMRSIVPYPTGVYLYSLIFYAFELSFMPLSFVFVVSLWNTIDRSARWVGDMLPKDELPHVDVYVVRYSESVDVLEPTVIAALNMNWPGDKLTVHILDDGAGKDVLKMVRRLRYQLTCMKREARLVYVARRRVHGVPHHAKAGNINHAILRSQGQGAFIMVLDTDMIAHPDFLQRTIGHFYHRGNEGSGGWVQKKRTAFIQTPQDFWNVPPSDPMVHCARFFYGPMLQGRDGVGATPCCGTGVVFNRTSLVSIGGQSYGSITEDYNTSMNLFASGFSSMFLNERLVYGMAPEGLIDVFKQRQRWAMGALQIIFNDNPLKKTGLTLVQSMLFFEAGAYHFLAAPTLLLCLVPFTFIFLGVAPVTAYHMWEFAAAFAPYFLTNRLTMWVSARGIKGADIELWRGWQMWIWMAPNHIKAIWAVIKSETFLRKIFRSKPIAFKVTGKEGSSRLGSAPPVPKDIHALWDTFCVTWYFVLYDLLLLAAIVYIIYGGVTHLIAPWILVVDFTSLFWVSLNCWCIWPPVSTLLPRVETAQGWRIQWKALVPGAVLETDLSGFGTTAMKISRAQTLPPRNSGAPQQFLELGRFSGNGHSSAHGAAVAVARSYRNEELTTTQDTKSDKSGNLASSQSDALVVAPKWGQAGTPNGQLSSATTRASSGNFGRVAAPLLTSASMQASALLTATILPERDAHSSVAARQPSLLAVAPSGELFPAPAGSMPYDILPSAFSLGGGMSITRRASLGRNLSIPRRDSLRRDSLQGVSFDQQIQMAAEQAMRGTSSKAPPPDPLSRALSPAFSLQRAPSAKPSWMPTTIEEDASFRGSRVSYSGPNGQAMLKAATAEAGDVIAAAAAKLLTVAEAEEELETAAAEESNPFAGYGAFTSDSESGGNTGEASRQASAMLRATLAGGNAANELAALAALTGDFDALRGLAPVTNSPFVIEDIRTREIPSIKNSPAGASPRPPPPPPPAFRQQQPSSQVVSPRNAKVSFQGVSPFDADQGPPVPFNAPKQQLPADTTGYLEQSIRIDGAQESTFLTDSLILHEQAALEENFLSPFAAMAENAWGTLNAASESAPSAAQIRKRAASRQLLDIAATLSPGSSAALRTGSVLVVPVMPASIFDHSIVAKPSFEASPPAPRDFTYLIVTMTLVLGLIACSLAEVPLRNVDY
ncbi:hypothetical protein Ndes2526B_g07738 [Nannochloris sp. 'desiccata']